MSVGYKWLLGPFGLGYLYVAEEHRDGEPIEQNWITARGRRTSPDSSTTATSTSPEPAVSTSAQRTEFELVPMAVAALEQLTAGGSDRRSRAGPGDPAIGARAAELGLDRPARGTARPAHARATAVPDDRAQAVLPALAAADCFAAVRGRSLRIAPHLHTTEGDIDQLISTLATITSGPAGGELARGCP